METDINKMRFGVEIKKYKTGLEMSALDWYYPSEQTNDLSDLVKDFENDKVK